MKTLVLGIRQQSGIAKESGKPYKINPQMLVGSSMTPVQSERISIQCAGLECLMLDTTADVFQQLTGLQASKFPLWLDLETMLQKRGENTSVLVTSFRDLKAA